MATKGTRYEYKLLDIPDEANGSEVESLLNKLGDEGWWVISISHGSLFDEQAWGTALLVRAT